MDRPAIAVRGLRKSYGADEVLHGIDFDVEPGEVFGLLGPNGAGKTTTIEILEGYRERSAGDVAVLGVDPGRPTRAWREQVGLVLQESQLEPLLTVRETLSLFASFYRSPRPVDETIELVGLSDGRDRRVGALSGGQRRRLDVAVGLIGAPRLLFLDEPTTGFDPSARRSAWHMIDGLRSLGTTIFLTTHYMEEAQYLADRVAILRDGKVAALGRPGELGSRETVIRYRRPGTEEIITLRTTNPQRTLYELTSWAEREHVDLDGLEATRPTLENVFLELTGGGHE
jgi:ABC-2 type transport system ATP-binding protein